MKAAMLSIVFALASWVPQVGMAQTWEHYPGLAEPGNAGILAGDYDGDGRSEVAVTGTFGYGALLAMLGADESGNYAVRGISTLPFGIYGILGHIVAAPQENGADRLAALVSDGNSNASTRMAVIGGVPARVLRTVEVPGSDTLVVIADVDGDGKYEIVSNNTLFHQTFIIDYETGEVEWATPYAASAIGIAKLHDGAGFDLVLGGSPGRIVDGATGAVEWSYPASFGAVFATGRLFSDPSTRGFASTTNGLVQIFRSQPYSPVSEFSVTDLAGAIATVPSTSGSVDYIAVGTIYAGRVDMFDPTTGVRVQSFSDVNDRERPGVTSIALVHPAGTAGKQIVFNAGLGSSGKRQLRIMDMATHASKFVMDAEYGPYSAVARGDVPGNGSDQVVYVTTKSDRATDMLDGQMLRVLDASNGRVLRERALPTSSGFSHVALTQVDNDPQLEIVLVSGDYSEIAVLDGLTLNDQWRLNTSALGSVHMSDLAMIDVDGDGIADVVTTGAGKLHAFNGKNGARFWQPLVVTGVGAMSAVTFQQTTGWPAVAVAQGKELHVVDLRSRTQLANVTNSKDVLGLSQWGVGTACKVGVLVEGELAVRRCADLGVEHVRSMPWITTFFRPLDPDAKRFIVAAMESVDGYQLYEIGPEGEKAPLSAPLGDSLGAGNSGVAVVAPDGRHVDVILGSDYMVTRKNIELDLLFADGFD